MPGLQAALFPRGPSLFTPVTCFSAAPLSCLTTQTSLELKKIFPFITQLSSFIFSLSLAFSHLLPQLLQSANSLLQTLLHPYTLVSILTAMLERPFWKTLRVTSVGCEVGLRPRCGPGFLYSPFAPLHHSFQPPTDFQVLSFCILTHPKLKKVLIPNSIP